MTERPVERELKTVHRRGPALTAALVLTLCGLASAAAAQGTATKAAEPPANMAPGDATAEPATTAQPETLAAPTPAETAAAVPPPAPVAQPEPVVQPAPLPPVEPPGNPEPEPEPAPAREADEDAPFVVPPIQLNLTEDGKSYLRMITWSQFWVRAMELNPGTELKNSSADVIGDVGIRRARFLMFGKITPEILVLLHMGINNQTFDNDRKPQVFVHDAWAQFDVLDNYLSLGAGLHYWKGVSRMSNASTFRFLAVDAPIINWPTIELTDQFARDMGVFAKGQIDRLDYRVAINKPFQTDFAPTTEGAIGIDSGSGAIGFGGYFQYMFNDIEGNLLPFTAGTYLGTKNVFNIGLGAQYQANAMVKCLAADDTACTDTERHDMLLIGLDAFLDRPIGDGALTAYGAYYFYDFGPDYVRNVGIMPVGQGGTSFNGAANRYPVIGTGHHIYAQAGYLLPVKVGSTQLQPFAALQLSFMEGLDDSVFVPEVGLNWLIAGQNAKLTAHYRNRPIFVAGDGKPVADSRASELITQLQILF